MISAGSRIPTWEICWTVSKKSMTDVASDRDQEVRDHRHSCSRYSGPVEISGSLAGETCMEKAVGIAAMVKTKHLPMQKIAEKLEQELKVKAVVAGRGSSYGISWSVDHTGNKTSPCNS